jgi:RND family efflux transporter MFP subunit
MKPYPMRALYAGALALALLCCCSCREPDAAKAAQEPAKPARLVVVVAPAREQTLTRTVEVQGALFPREKTVLAAQADGAISAVMADFGDRVAAGQVLCRIDPREYRLRLDSARAQLEQAQARLVNATANFHRASELKKNGLIPQQQFDEISSTLRVARADAEAAANAVGLAQTKFDYTYVRAPFAAYVQKRMVSLGEHVGTGTPVYELIAIDPIKLRASIPERFVPRLRVGLPINLSVEANPERVYSGVVRRIAPALDDASRTLLIEAEVPNPDGSLRPGYFAHVTVNLGRDRALFVPQSAVMRYAGVSRVFVLEHGVLRSREVETGVTLDTGIEIVKGLRPGERVVTSDLDRLADGLKAVAKEQSPS